jgi:hypothetical protein
VSTYPTAPAHGGYNTTAAPASKPATLLAAVAISVISGLAALTNGVLMLTGGAKLAADMAAQSLADIAGVSVEEARATAGLALDAALGEVQSTIETRAYIAIVFGGALALFGFLMRNAATYARVLVTITAVLAAGISMIVALDVSTSLMAGLAWVAVLGSLISIVMTWLSPNGRYAKARKKA